jgi:phenylpropionate dioxygenase-like ring-hydroxylating dioxygenase large terminal subunit
VPVAVDTWGPFVFANAAPDPEPLAQALGSLPAQVAELGLDVDSLVYHSRWEAEIDANWKIVCENFLECYHCQVAHPGFSEVIDVSPEAYVLSSDGRLSTQHGPVRTGNLQGPLPRSQFHFLWPNLEINIFPGEPNISIGPSVPRTPERTYRLLDYFFGPDVEQAWIDDLLAFDDQVGREDAELVKGVQRGIASGALEHGMLMSRSEQLIGHFQALTAAALTE